MAQGDELVAAAIAAQTVAMVTAINALTTATQVQTAGFNTASELLAQQVLQAAATLAAQTAEAAELVAAVSAEVNKLRLVAMNTVINENGKPRVIALDSHGVIWEYIDSNDTTKITNHAAYNWRIAAAPAPLERGGSGPG